MFISINVLNAECSDVKADIENVSYQLYNISSNEESKVEILVYGLTEEMYLLVSEDYDGESVTYNYSDTDEGKITITSNQYPVKLIILSKFIVQIKHVVQVQLRLSMLQLLDTILYQIWSTARE